MLKAEQPQKEAKMLQQTFMRSKLRAGLRENNKSLHGIGVN
jgi:hypothetical protein